MSSDAGEIIPVGSVVSELRWWNTPDKYQGPAWFDSLDEARGYDRTGSIVAELRLVAPDGRPVRVVGAVDTVGMWAEQAPPHEDGVVPEVASTVVDLARRDRPRTRYESAPRESDQTRIEDVYDRITFQTPSGEQFVLRPMTTHPMQDQTGP